MAFTKRAHGVASEMRQSNFEDSMTAQGWVTSVIPEDICKSSGIEVHVHESGWGPRTFWVRAWAYALLQNWLRSPDFDWHEFGLRLREVHVDYQEQRLLCAELTLSLDVSRRTRQAATNYITLLDERDRFSSGDGAGQNPGATSAGGEDDQSPHR